MGTRRIIWIIITRVVSDIGSVRFVHGLVAFRQVLGHVLGCGGVSDLLPELGRGAGRVRAFERQFELLDCQNNKCHRKTYPSLRPYWASEAPPTSEFNRAERRPRLRFKGHARDVVEVPEHRTVPFRQALYNLDEVLLVLHGVDRRRYFAHALAFQMSRMFLIGHTVVVVSPTFRENLLDLLVVEDDGKGDCLQLFERISTPAGACGRRPS